MIDYEELMLQISDVMREANRLRPILSHEQAVKNIRGIVERHGKWIEESAETGALGIKYTWVNCSECGWGNSLVIPKNFCPNCGARMDR